MEGTIEKVKPELRGNVNLGVIRPGWKRVYSPMKSEFKARWVEGPDKVLENPQG